MRNFFTFIVLVLSCTNVIHTKPTFFPDEQDTCLNTCPSTKEGVINVHLVPHSHDDVGWLKTVDQYYYGSRINIQRASVQYILDSVIHELSLNKNRKFIQVETAFFWKWWLEQDEVTRKLVKNLVNNNQLEITGGGWSMNDEAAVHYQSIIDQFTWGLRRINDTFGVCGRPKVGWQIDPFGHSREMASIFAQMGYDGVFFARLDHADRFKRTQEKTLELMWRGSASLGEDSDLFTGAFTEHYSPPRGFNFDVNSDDEPIVDDKNSPDYNVPQRIRAFVDHCEFEAKSFQTNNIMLKMGDDFHYSAAHWWYKNLDKLIQHVNELYGDKVYAFYSTPACYLQRVHDANKTWTTKTDDFFPYSDSYHSYWTGYYSSRPATKFLERQGNNVLQICKQLAVTTDSASDSDENLIALREAMAVFQHHDAITGTEKEHVAKDYVRQLSKAIAQCETIISNSLKKLLSPTKSSTTSNLEFKQCRLNISVCDVTETSQNFATVIYNPSSQNADKYVRLPIIGDSYSVKDNEGNAVENQIIPLSEGVLNLPGRQSEAKQELVFLAPNVPPLGYKVYQITRENSKKSSHVSQKSIENSIGNDRIEIYVNEGDNQRLHLKTKDVNCSQQLLFYEGGHKYNRRSSGAYAFCPESNEATALEITDRQTYTGPLVEEIHQKVGEWAYSVGRVYKNLNYAEFDWIVGPIPINDNKGKEVINRFQTNLRTDSTFYTDSNGRELLRRVKDHRDTWELIVASDEEVSANYYPVTSRIALTKDNTRFAVFTDRAQGGSSLADGQIELMVHRRLLHDDGFGVGEPLNETEYETAKGQNGLVVKGTHYVFSSSNTSPSAAFEERQIAAQKILAPLVFVANIENVNSLDLNYHNIAKLSAINDHEIFPPNVQILTLEPWKDGKILLRLEHILEKTDDETLSESACVNIENLFKPFQVENLRETTLDGNQWIEDKKRLKWKTEGLKSDAKNNSAISENYKCTENGNNKFEIVLNAMQIRTFVLDVKHNF